MPYSTLLRLILCLLPAGLLRAQPVLYAPFSNQSANTDFEVIGKAGNYYWVHKTIKSHNSSRGTAKRANNKEATFDLYDARLNPLKEIRYRIQASVIKEYLVAGEQYLDQLLFDGGRDSVRVLLNRFAQDGVVVAENMVLLNLPGSLKAADFLLHRSGDKSKILLLGFETVLDAAPRLHVALFNSNWKVLFKTVYTDARLAQPLLQLDFTSFPLAAFDYSPVAVANSGDWLMVAPSRRTDGFMLCHFRHSDSTLVQRPIKQAQGPAVQNFCLSFDDEAGEAIAGILVHTNTATIKKAHVAHYILAERKIVFDTTYRFRSVHSGTLKEAHLFEQHFMPLPGKGFLYLKEYGRPFSYTYGASAEAWSKEESDTAGMDAAVAINKKSYTRYPYLFSGKRTFERGDLVLNYLPAKSGDSCWSGLINMTQDERKPSYLSYACIPVDSKLLFLYNSPAYSYSKLSSTTVLDEAGNALNESLLFWKGNNVMNFQKLKGISRTELAVPYERARLQGFAIIRL